MIGLFWRQIIKGGLISLITLLILTLILYSFFNNNVVAEEKPSENGCYERDHIHYIFLIKKGYLEYPF